jgi:hypothetical protein
MPVPKDSASLSFQTQPAKLLVYRPLAIDRDVGFGSAQPIDFGSVSVLSEVEMRLLLNSG